VRKNTTYILQALVALIGVSVLAFMLIEPHFEGRNIHSTFSQVYLNDPFLAYAYIGSIPFFVGLCKVFTLLGSIRRNMFFSPESIKALRTIRYCALMTVGLVIAGGIYFVLPMRGKDDIAGGVAMGFFVIVISALTAIVSGIFERKMQTVK
jgi:hypothetical protein